MGENYDFVVSNDLEFEGTKQGFWGTNGVFKSPKFSFPSFNLGLQEYKDTPFKNTVTPFGTPNFLWPPYHGSRGT